jgi:AcrR family transcriptional regulator
MAQNIPLDNMIDSLAPQLTERADAAANRLRILQVAEELFAARGVENVNMAEIAEAAGVGKGTLYRRFANKAELCLSLIDEQMAAFQNDRLAEMRLMTAQGVAQMEQLATFLEALVHFTDTHSPILCEVQRAGLLPEADQINPALPHFWQYMTVHALLKTAVAQNEIPADLDLDYLADALLAPLKADLFRFQRQARGFTLAQISQGLRTLVRAIQALSLTSP